MKVNDMTANNPSYGRVFNSFQEVCNFLDADVPPNQYVPAKTAEVRQATESEAPIEVPGLSFKSLADSYDPDEQRKWELENIHPTPASDSGERGFNPTPAQTRAIQKRITTDSVNPDNYGRALGVDRNKGRTAMAQARANVEARDIAAVERAGQRFREGKARAAQDRANQQAAKAAQGQGQQKSQASATPKKLTPKQQQNQLSRSLYLQYCERFEEMNGRAPNKQESNQIADKARIDAERQLTAQRQNKTGKQSSANQVAGTQSGQKTAL